LHRAGIEVILDVVFNQRLDHVAELVHRGERIPARAVGLVWRSGTSPSQW